MTPRTLAQKLVGRACGDPQVQPGDIVTCRVDRVMATDVTAPLSIEVFRRMGGTRVADPAACILVNDHFVPAKDIPAAKRVFADWPTPIEASGWEIGQAILIPARCIERDFAWSERNPVREAFFHYGKWPYDRPAWDLTSVLQAVRPESGYFGLSEPGRIEVDDAGHAVLRPDPDGTRRFFTMTPEQAVRVREALMLLSTQPPRRRTE